MKDDKILKKVEKELKSYLSIGKAGEKEAKELEHKAYWRGWLRVTEELTSYINTLKEMK